MYRASCRTSVRRISDGSRRVIWIPGWSERTLDGDPLLAYLSVDTSDSVRTIGKGEADQGFVGVNARTPRLTQIPGKSPHNIPLPILRETRLFRALEN